MTNLLNILRRIALPCAAALIVAVLEALLIDPKVLRSTLFVFLATLPSILAYAICAELAPARLRLRHVAFFIPALLVLALCLYGQTVQGGYINIPALTRGILIAYLLQILPAYLILLALPSQQS